MHTGTPWHSTLHALCFKPDIHFTNQKEGEIVLLSLRTHPITLLPAIFNILIIFILMSSLNFIIPQFLGWFATLYINVFFIFFLCIYAWILFTNWYFNIGIITNQQIIDIDFNIVLSKEMTRTGLTSVEDVTVKTSGFFPGIFNYGNIFIQTAGTQINTEFLAIPRPGKVGQIIQDIIRQYGRSKQSI